MGQLDLRSTVVRGLMLVNFFIITVILLIN